MRLVSGTSHWLMMDRPDDTNRLLDVFLAQVEAVRPRRRRRAPARPAASEG